MKTHFSFYIFFFKLSTPFEEKGQPFGVVFLFFTCDQITTEGEKNQLLTQAALLNVSRALKLLCKRNMP